MKEKTTVLLSFLLLFVSTTACSQNNQQNNTDGSMDNVMYLHIGSRTLTATLVDNSSTRALKQLLENNPIVINMSDYGNFEKVGGLGTTLPRNDVRISTNPGDIILYQGNQIVIFYAPNTWSYTRIGRINNVSQQELRNILGAGNVTVTLSLHQ